MEKTVLISLPVEDLQTIITDCVNSCLKHNPQNTLIQTPPDFKYLAIKDIFKKKICSKPTFYAHLKAGDFHLFKFGNKSFVDAEEFLKAFHKVKMGNKKGVSNG